MVGQVISHYKILVKLGEGGMGVVYKAEDTKLKRSVALKFLPANLTQDQQAKIRFLHEAQAASALDHPNICTIHEINETEDSQMFIVMAYYEGETLQQKLAKGGLPLTEAIDIAIQISQGLAKAHEHNIVHRDLKPANVIITRDSMAKILDFGLAKLAGQLRLTKTGSTLGTMAYMSPEQLRGGEADHRADIWALGVVLHEMLTGELPFKGEYEHSLMYSILNEEAKPITQVCTGVPKVLERIVVKALVKTSNERYQHVEEMLADLKLLTSNLAPNAVKTIKKRLPKGKPYFSKVSIATFLILLLTVGLVAVIGYSAFFSRPSTDASLPPLKTTRLTSFEGEEFNPALSPDGNMIAFAWNGPQKDNSDIYVKLIDAGTPLRLTNHPASDMNPTWSPDGRYLAFNRATSSSREIIIIPALGGNERKLMEANPTMASSMCWSADGKALFITDLESTQSPLGIFEISVETSTKRNFVTTGSGDQGGDHSPRVSPDGKTLAFIHSKSYGVDDIYIIPVTGGEPKRITSFESGLCGLSWTAGGREVVFSSERGGGLSLWRVSVSADAPKPLAVAAGSCSEVSASLHRNRLAFNQINNNANIWRIDLTNQTRSAKLISSTQQNFFPQYSADGKKIAFASDRSGSNEVWVCDADGTNQVQLTFFGDALTDTPRWSPDGKRIAFASRSAGISTIYVMLAAGGKPHRLTSNYSNADLPSWSRDGRWIYFVSNPNGAIEQIWKIPAEGGGATQITKNGGAMAFESVDGKYVYYSKKDSVWQVPSDGGAERAVVGPLSGLGLGWAVTKKGIYFIDPHAVLFFFNVSNQSVKRVKAIEAPVNDWGLAVSPDERWLLYAQFDHHDSDIMLVENFR